MACEHCKMGHPADPATATIPAAFNVSHYDLLLCADFSGKRMFGQAKLTIDLIEGGSKLTLDAHHLDVVHVTDVGRGASLKFATRDFTGFGSALDIELAQVTLGTVQLEIHYSTRPSAPATCWLNPAQTAGKTHPFLFTQGQACLNRSFFPCQDTPAVRCTYNATILVPKSLAVVMSAARPLNEVKGDTAIGIALDGPTDPLVAGLYVADTQAERVINPDEYHAFKFEMPFSIPVYLVAMAIGNLKCAEIGPRSRVWTEPANIEKASFEFGHDLVTEKYVATGESLFGPYRWGRYDIVVMPPSFPFGGMENPCLTFVTPALLAGDQSLTDVVAHEIAHSWFGNLVTNSTWSEFFLNEGFTMYAQRRITSEVHGVPFTALETTTGRALLRLLMRDIGHDHPLTRLRVPLEEGIDPDDTYNESPYEKGYAFISYLAHCAIKSTGNASAFDDWLKVYCEKFAFKCVTALDMLNCYFDHFQHLKGTFWSDPAAAGAQIEAEGPKYWTSGNAAPEDLSASCVLQPHVDQYLASVSPATASAAGTSAAPGSGAAAGLAVVPGYELSRWMHQPGWPVYYPSTSAAQALTRPADALVSAWIDAVKGVAAAEPTAVIPEPTISSPPSSSSAATEAAVTSGFSTWPIYQKLYFLDSIQVLLEHGLGVDAGADAWHATAYPQAVCLLLSLDAVYHLGSSSNAEIRLRWSQLVAAAQLESSYDAVLGFAMSTGKQKYTVPIYRALLSSKAKPDGATPNKDLAAKMFAMQAEQLHYNVMSKVAGLLRDAGLRTA